ncbi:Fatty acid desaturase [Rosistilla oblonga]|uniref:Fatty acid desaturase n=1 Tax=Rosistilla oblonga TaxID=2527990 RepID=A0A518IP84_9BACT|nr:acyl-CoA desaturase [Rosistilla oblonga]QDV11043.1 Fatty acid desaturase [Rosistilla oblonga]QDV54888.1 Fatty acid desaturase [Rosistilla oblonga]
MATVVDDAFDLAEQTGIDAGEVAKSKKQKAANLSREERTIVNTYSIIWLVAAHVGAIFAIWTFTWPALIAMVTLHWITGGLGICLGYHRYLTHTGFQSHRWVKYMFAVIGSLAGEGSPLDWVADHRKHHAESDQPGDPHSPNDGAWWSHMFWLAYSTHDGDREAYFKRWIPDLAADRGMRFIEKMFLPLNFALGVALAVGGYLYGGSEMAISMVVWGMFLRLVFVLHSTWLVNSASHMWGYRNYETTDKSRNNWWVALVTYGEGWHNNHHAYPRMAKHGHKWWEIDLTYMAIRAMQKVGLIWKVVDYRNVAEKKAKQGL